MDEAIWLVYVRFPFTIAPIEYSDYLKGVKWKKSIYFTKFLAKKRVILPPLPSHKESRDLEWLFYLA